MVPSDTKEGPKYWKLTVYRHYSTLVTLVTARIKLVALLLSHAPTSFQGSPEQVVAPRMIPSLRQPSQKTTSVSLFPPPLPTFFSFSSSSIQFSHPSSFPKVSFNSSPAVPFTPAPSPPSSIFPSSRYPTPPCDLQSNEAHKPLQNKKSPQTWSPRYALGVALGQCAVLLTLLRSGRYQRFRSYWPHCKLLSPTPRPRLRAQAPSRLELTRVTRSSAMRKLTCPSSPQRLQALCDPNWPNGFLTSSQYRRWRCRSRRCQRPLH